MTNRWLPRVLVADDEEIQRNILREILSSVGYEVKAAANVEATVTLFQQGIASGKPYDLVITDLKMPGKTEGLDLLARIKEIEPRAEVVLMTAFSEVSSAVRAMKLGAFEYLAKPFDRERLLHVAAQAADKLRLVQENRELRALVQDGTSSGKLLGRAPAMRQLFDLIARVAPISTNCLIRGESGTGKELVARAIHFSGPRAQQPFIAINCAAIPETLIESEIFGHEKGAFTGAASAKAGRFEEVGEGTLFLDEIGSMKYDLQAKLLRVIQEREFSRVGSSQLQAFRGRIVAATAQDLEASVAENKFREDLYFRLNVVPLEIPPLRDRVEDIPLLVEHLVQRCSKRLGKQVKGVTPGVLEAFEAYRWPGNVRELENTIERMIVLSDGDSLDEHLLPTYVRSGRLSMLTASAPPARGNLGQDEAAASVHSAKENGGFRLPAAGVIMEELEADLIRQALERSMGRIEPAAQLLGITYKTLQYRIKKYNLRCVQEAGRRGEQEPPSQDEHMRPIELRE